MADLAEAARHMEARHGLSAVDGGRHPGWGTENRIVPLGETYLELIAVADAKEAVASRFGSWVSAAQPAPANLLGWAVRTSDLDDIAARHGLHPVSGSRRTHSDEQLRWRLAGMEEATAEPSLPFFIAWEEGTSLPGRAPAAHRVGHPRLRQLQLSGDHARLAAWLGPHRLPVTIRPGQPAVTGLILDTDAGAIVIDSTSALCGPPIPPGPACARAT